MKAGVWSIQLEAPRSFASSLSDLLETHCDAVICQGTEDDPDWRLQGICSEDPDRAKLKADLARAAKQFGLDPLTPYIRFLEDRDWTGESLSRFPPIRVGRFFVHGSHVTEPAPEGCLGVLIDASTAFGSGTHASTRGCLLALEQLAQQPVSASLDLGCGSAILAIAAAGLWGRPVIAADLDADALEVARINAERNRVSDHIRCVFSDGYGAPEIAEAGPYDLILANILAAPLIDMAVDLASNLAPGGHAVLSGFIARDADWVADAHLAHGLNEVARIAVEDWVTLILENGA